jgi:serine/threonine-protein phosphatase 6 regulatory ankyrin repeat subunit B
MDAIREIQQYAKEIIALFALISGAIFGTKHFFRWRISHEGGAYNRAAFFDAVANGEIQLVRWFLWAGINPKRLHQGATALICAVEKQHLDIIRLFVSRSWINFWRRWVDPNQADGNGVTPVHLSVELRRRDLYDALTGAEARTDSHVRAGVLRQTAENGDEEEMRARVRALQPGEIDLKGREGRNALLIAVSRPHLRIVRLLLDENADPNAHCNDMTALLLAAHDELSQIAEELAFRPRTDVNATGPAGETPLILAAEGGSLGLVKVLLERNALVDAHDHRGRTALMAAILGGYPAIAALLRQRGTAGEGDARLILAAAEGNVEQVGLYLEGGANPNAQGARGRSALLDAARNDHPAVAQLLIDAGANVDITDDQGNTALMLSGQVGARGFAAVLLQRGAKRSTRRNDGSTALMDAASGKHGGVVEEILSNEPKPTQEEVDTVRGDGFTPLMASVDRGERGIADRLLDAGADPNVRTESGLSPLMIAITHNDRPMAELLRHRGAVIGEDEGQLFVEARRGNLERVRQLLDLGVSTEVQGPRGTTPLLEAVHGGHFHVAALLLEHGANVSHAGGGHTALEWAVRGNHSDIVTLLLGKGAPVDARDSRGKTPLLLACEKYNPAILDALLAAKAGVDAADSLGRTPLLVALVNRRAEVEVKLRGRGATKGELEAQLILAARDGSAGEVRRLLALRPFVDTPGPGGETALIMACEHADVRVVAALLNANADVDVKTSPSGGKTALCVAARRGDLAILDALLGAGARADLTGPDDRTPVMIAAEHGHLEAVKRLLHVKDIPNERDRAGMTALMLAAQNGLGEIVSELLAASAEIEARGPEGRTALMLAAAAGHADPLRRLLAAGADIHGRDEQQSSALILASFGGHLATTSELVARDADVDARDDFGQTPLMLAILSENAPIETILRAAEATLGENEAKLIDAATRGDFPTVRTLLDGPIATDAHRRGDDTALIAAIANEHAQIALLLIDQGANVNIKGRLGRTALILASAHNAIEVVYALTAHEAEKTCEAMDEEGTIAVLATSRPDIRLHLQVSCHALQPESTVYVTRSGRCYHTERCGTAKYGDPAQLLHAVGSGLRPCSACITNQ